MIEFVARPQQPNRIGQVYGQGITILNVIHWKTVPSNTIRNWIWGSRGRFSRPLYVLSGLVVRSNKGRTRLTALQPIANGKDTEGTDKQSLGRAFIQ